MKEQVKRFYEEKDMVPEEYRQKALHFIDQVPDATTCLHGDLQIGNVITDGKRTLWIDVGEFAYGTAEWDLGMFCSMSHRMDNQRALSLFHITHETFLDHWNIFFPAYLGTTDQQAIDEASKRLLPFAAAKIPYVFNLVGYGRMPNAVLESLIKMFG